MNTEGISGKQGVCVAKGEGGGIIFGESSKNVIIFLVSKAVAHRLSGRLVGAHNAGMVPASARDPFVGWRPHSRS